MSQKINIKFYRDDHDRDVFENWLRGFKDMKTELRIWNRLNRLRLGNFGDYKYLDKGVYELRCHFGSGFRIYFGLIDSKNILVLCGGDKRTQDKDIQRAQAYWRGYKESSWH